MYSDYWNVLKIQLTVLTDVLVMGCELRDVKAVSQISAFSWEKEDVSTYIFWRDCEKIKLETRAVGLCVHQVTHFNKV